MEIQRITSFSIDHNVLVPGFYISRVDGNIVTYDLRTRRPNAGDYMTNSAMHSVEHLFATYIRNSEMGPDVVYFGPMGCQTGFYLLVKDRPVLVVAAGDVRVDNRKFKAFFHTKAKMIPAEEVEACIGHAVGGVCPFGVNEGVAVYLDESLKRFETVFPACGSGNSAIELTIPELEQVSRCLAWVDVCKGWRPEEV